VSVTGERLGVFGGTFDPPHIGHFVAAVNASFALSLDRVLLVVSNIPWQKVGDRRLTPARDRFDMVRAAVAGHPHLEASDLELRRGGESTTADTVEALAAEDSTRQLFVIVGADAADGLRTWRRWTVVAERATLVVVERAGQAGAAADWPGRLERVAIPRLDVSSTDLRRRVAAGEPLDYLVPDGVAALVTERLLYSGGT
jgi:nicotinate-nucleotide adenylyltransferase